MVCRRQQLLHIALFVAAAGEQYNSRGRLRTNNNIDLCERRAEQANGDDIYRRLQSYTRYQVYSTRSLEDGGGTQGQTETTCELPLYRLVYLES